MLQVARVAALWGELGVVPHRGAPLLQAETGSEEDVLLQQRGAVLERHDSRIGGYGRG